MEPLALPPRSTQRSVAELARYTSVALFLQRATAVKPDFTLTTEIAPAVVEICGKLDYAAQYTERHPAHLRCRRSDVEIDIRHVECRDAQPVRGQKFLQLAPRSFVEVRWP